MQDYWEDSPVSQQGPSIPSTSLANLSTLKSEYDLHRLNLVRDAGLNSDSGGWKMELQ